MIITDENIAFSTDIIDSCLTEMSDSVENRSKFLDSLVASRLRKCNDLYLEEYHKSVERLMRYIEIDAVSLRDIPRYMKKVGRNMKALYNAEREIYRIL